MRIIDAREASVPMQGNISNAVVNFSEHDVSLVAIVSDVVRDGKRVTGYAFNSIGRFAQGGIIQSRMFPRLLKADPQSLLDATGNQFDPAKVLACILRNEKPGGHGDRAGAAAAIELAIWDLNAKLADEPAYATIAKSQGLPISSQPVDVYAAGGYYYPKNSAQSLTDELKRYQEMGFSAFKMKIGGASLSEDMSRIEEAIAIAGHGSRIAVDANGRFDLVMARSYASAMSAYGLRWFEEIGDPLDYELNRNAIGVCSFPVATGENLFSLIDSQNLIRYGGMRPGKDIFQMDAGISYGLTEYFKIINLLEANGYSRKQAFPHGGHLINLHIVFGMGLGGCEAYPGVFQPFGGYSPFCQIDHGKIVPSSAPGFGLEEKPNLYEAIRKIME